MSLCGESRNLYEQGDGGVSLLKQSERQVKIRAGKITRAKVKKKKRKSLNLK